MALVADLIRELPEGAGAVPLPMVRRIINDHLDVQWDRALQSVAVKAGTIRPLPIEGRELKVDRAQARLILTAAWVAEAAQLPVVTAIRAAWLVREDREIYKALTQAA